MNKLFAVCVAAAFAVSAAPAMAQCASCGQAGAPVFSQPVQSFAQPVYSAPVAPQPVYSQGSGTVISQGSGSIAQPAYSQPVYSQPVVQGSGTVINQGSSTVGGEVISQGSGTVINQGTPVGGEIINQGSGTVIDQGSGTVGQPIGQSIGQPVYGSPVVQGGGCCCNGCGGGIVSGGIVNGGVVQGSGTVISGHEYPVGNQGIIYETGVPLNGTVVSDVVAEGGTVVETPGGDVEKAEMVDPPAGEGSGTKDGSPQPDSDAGDT